MPDVHNSVEDVQLYGLGLDSPVGADVGNTKKINNFSEKEVKWNVQIIQEKMDLVGLVSSTLMSSFCMYYKIEKRP